MKNTYISIGLHMHQPPENLRVLIEGEDWEAQQIIAAYERPARYAHEYKDVAALQVGFSGILLEQFRSPDIVDRYRKFIDIPYMLDLYRTADNIEIIGMGYYHPLFPLTPKEDWAEHLSLGREIAEEVFGRSPKGFWPSEMAFSMEMIPALKAAGYEYVVVDHVHVNPLVESERPDFFKPYLATHEGEAITIVPRNRDVSNAQESGMDPGWYQNEVNHKLGESPSSEEARLVVTWSDGENGGWFRRMDEGSSFFGYFFSPLLEQIRSGQSHLRLTTLSDFLSKYPAREQAHVNTGAWNVASTSGYDFSQWAGSEAQRKAVEALCQASASWWKEKSAGNLSEETIAAARRELLESETSCYLFWGDDWLPKLYEKLEKLSDMLKPV